MATDPSVADLVTSGTAAHLAGEYDRAVKDLLLAYRRSTDAGDSASAFSVAFSLAMVFGTTGQPAQFNGWVVRAGQLLEGMSEGYEVGRGYLYLLELHRAVTTGDVAAAAALAPRVAEVGRTEHVPDLLVMGEVALGRAAIYGGDVRGGLDLLDGVMAAVLAEETGPLVTGLAWCAAVEGCQEIGAVDRVCEWTTALVAWCESHPGLELFAGHCSVHHGQVLTLQGRWDEALRALADSRLRHERRGDIASAGWAECGRGDILRLRGQTAEAAKAYRTAADLGADPQPGSALLWLTGGRTDAAVAAVRRVLAQVPLPALRIGLLPGVTEVLLAAGEIDDAAGLADELDGFATLTGCTSVSAAAAYAHARVDLARGDPAGALPYARRAVLQWGEVGCPYEVARARVVLARSCAALGDTQTAAEELATARRTFAGLGAGPADREAAGLTVELGLEVFVELDVAGAPRPDPSIDLGTPTASDDGLTPRELEVLALVAAGLSNRQLARELVISDRTVARHLSNIFTKIDVVSRTEAAAYAFRHGLAPP